MVKNVKKHANVTRILKTFVNKCEKMPSKCGIHLFDTHKPKTKKD